ncbi:MAG: hypothetical protein HOP11_05420 [Saprospiraceae bacterium]|nr:hypothetical protein [Saprospiraceae bacterium]
MVTDYDLNIPYDLNSEVEGTDGKSTNSFYHSLPTLQGNVGTNLTVVRSKNDPITHNENIHVNLETELKSKFISTPIDLRYYLNDFNKGLSFGLLLSPSIEFNKTIEARAAHSFHTYVKEKSLNLTVEKSGASFHLGYGLLTGYRLGLFRNWMLDTRVEYRLNHLNSYNIGRFNFGIGILNRF